ncbi:MAG: hypothetical protein JRN06_06595 [Nitrososphaerota archaeon]|nr:hypothetical protein [Nitrososphaerota archaeon]
MNWRESDVFIHPSILAATKLGEKRLVELFNSRSYSLSTIEGNDAERRLVNGLLLYHVLSDENLILGEKEGARYDKAKLSGLVFQDIFERLSQVWMSGRSELFLANVDSYVKGMDYVVCERGDAVRYRAGIQCRFSISAASATNNSYQRLKERLAEVRRGGALGDIPLAVAAFRTENNVPSPLNQAVGAQKSVVFLNRSGKTGLAIRYDELKGFAAWLASL